MTMSVVSGSCGSDAKNNRLVTRFFNILEVCGVLLIY